MQTKKTFRNILLWIFFCFYISLFLFSTMHLDLSRDVQQAFRIVNREDFPLNGQILGGRFRLGPVWYYFLAIILWLFKGWLSMVMVLATLAGTQVFFAYLLGKELQDRQAGMIFSALVLFPSWCFFEQMFPTHVIFVPALTMVVMISAARYAKNGNSKYIAIQAFAFSLALHAHPTALIVVVPALYFNFFGYRCFGCNRSVLLLAALLLLLPFSPMLFYQIKEGFPLMEQVMLHAEGATQEKNWSKIYSLPLSVLSGFNYISSLLRWRNFLFWFYAFAGVVLILLILFNTSSKKNSKKIFFNIKINLIFLLMLFMQSGLLILLSSGHAYYYTSTLRLFIFASISVAISKVFSETNSGKYFFAVLMAATLFSNALIVHSAARWASEGILPVNIFPLADVSAKKSLRVWLPSVAAVHEISVEKWLCSNNFSSLHGSLGSHLIYNYAIESYFSCKNKEFIAGSNISTSELKPSYIGISGYLGRHVIGKIPIQVGSMHIYAVSQSFGTAFIPHPSDGTYPPYFDMSDRQKDLISVKVFLKKGEVLALTNFSHDYLQISKIIVQTEDGRELNPLAFDMQTKIYQCSKCDKLELKIIFESNMKDRVDILIF